MNILSLIIGIPCFALMVLGLVPGLGWLNWLVAVGCVLGILFGAASEKKPGLYINVAVLCVGGLRLLLGGGDGCVACGIGRGPRPAQRALRAALASPLSNMDALSHARSLMVQISGGDDLELQDTAEAISLLKERLPKDCVVHAGAALDPTLNGSAQVMVFGVGLAGPARLSLPWRQLRSSLSVLPGRLKLDLERGAYGFDAPPARSAAARKAV